MRLCSPREVVLRAGDTAFYPDTWRGLLAAGLIFGAIAGYAAIPKGTESTLVQALIPGLMALCLLAMAGRHRYGLRHGDGWRVVFAHDGVYLRLQEGRGNSGEAAVLFLDRAAVDHVRLVTEQLRLPHRVGTTRHHIAYVDFQLNILVNDTIRDACLSGHREYRRTGHSGPYPVLLPSDERMRICWGGLYPGEKKALEMLATRFRVLTDLCVVYPSWEHLAAEQQDRHVRMVWDMGMCAEAEFLLRMYRGLSRSAARSLLEGQGAAER